MITKTLTVISVSLYLSGCAHQSRNGFFLSPNINRTKLEQTTRTKSINTPKYVLLASLAPTNTANTVNTLSTTNRPSSSNYMKGSLKPIIEDEGNRNPQTKVSKWTVPSLENLNRENEDWLMNSKGYVVQVKTFYTSKSLNQYIIGGQINTSNIRVFVWRDKNNGLRYTVFTDNKFNSYSNAFKELPFIKHQTKVAENNMWIRSLPNLQKIRCAFVNSYNQKSNTETFLQETYCAT